MSSEKSFKMDNSDEVVIIKHNCNICTTMKIAHLNFVNMLKIILCVIFLYGFYCLVSVFVL